MSDMNQLTDEELMREYKNGHENAFLILYKRHSAQVYGYLLNRLRDRSVADDVFQATFLKLHQARNTYDASLPFMPWLFVICRSSLVDSVRKKQRTLEESDSEKVEATAAPLASELPVLPSLERLPDNQRKVIEWRYEGELSFEEIAQKLKISPLNARQMASRAIRKLRSWVKKGEGK